VKLIYQAERELNGSHIQVKTQESPLKAAHVRAVGLLQLLTP